VIARRAFLVAGAAVAMPALAQAHMRRIGYLSLRAATNEYEGAFVAALRERGHLEGRDIAIDYRFVDGDYAALDRAIAEVVASKPDLIVTTGPATRSVAKATATIPIVTIVADPIAQGLAATLGRPGGNVTGITVQSVDLTHKRLQLLREWVPGLRRVGALVVFSEHAPDPRRPDPATALVAEIASIARAFDIAIVASELRNGRDLSEAFARLRRERVQAAIVQLAPLTYDHRRTIASLAAEARIPTLYEMRAFVDDGGLVSYGPDLLELYRRLAGHADRILRGAKPGDLAFEQPGKLELVINLNVARSLRLAIPPAVLARADDVIR
jgi:putative ABC transport system substrate-binding protein